MVVAVTISGHMTGRNGQTADRVASIGVLRNVLVTHTPAETPLVTYSRRTTLGSKLSI